MKTSYLTFLDSFLFELPLNYVLGWLQNMNVTFSKSFKNPFYPTNHVKYSTSRHIRYLLLFRMRRENHRPQIPIFHGWLEHLRLYSRHCQHCGHSYGGYDGGLSGLTHFTPCGPSLQDWENTQANQGGKRHQEVTFCPYCLLACFV